jgi:hypothetical protein
MASRQFGLRMVGWKLQLNWPHSLFFWARMTTCSKPLILTWAPSRGFLTKEYGKNWLAILLNGQNAVGKWDRRFAAALSFGSGRSIAVWTKSHEHDLEISGIGERGRKLIQYQLVNILDLESKVTQKLTIGCTILAVNKGTYTRKRGKATIRNLAGCLIARSHKRLSLCFWTS